MRLLLWSPSLTFTVIMDRPFYKLDSVINNLLYCVLLTVLLIPSRSASAQSDCKIGEYDFSLLNRKQPWISVNPLNETYLFSLCSAIEGNGCPAGSAVCRQMHGSSSQAVKLGNLKPVISGNDQKQITVTFFAETCPSNPSKNFSTHIIFKCGKTLGSPEFLNEDGCSTVFEWESIVACKHLSKPVKEVPCYVYVQGKQRDLTPLIKLTGAYKVTSPSNVDIYINLCRDISSGNLCPNGSAACANISNTLVNLGEPKSGLRAIDSRTLEIKYETPLKPAICPNAPQTVINLICPKRGGSKSPIIVHEEKCRFDIEWLTEYACDEENINKPHLLKFNDPENDIDIDLMPLIPEKSKPYSVTVTEADNTKYTYYFGLNDSPKVCDDHGSKFDNFNPAICQVKGNQIKFLGSFAHSTLRYSDNHLMLIYKGGEPCSSNFQRITFIEFHCNKSAVNDGKGNPVFRTAVDCSYYFDWDTKYACLDHPVLHSCSVSHNGKLFDLSSLRSSTSQNWLSLNGHHYNSNADIFLNVCHDIIPEGKATGCPSDSAICMKGIQKSVNLGRYTQGPVYSPANDNIQLTYSEGDTCGDKKYKSIITFYCNPGVTNSAPVVVLKSEDGCIYHLEWHTAAACVQMHIFGANCRLSDDTSGYNFDLSPLTKKGTGKYEVSVKSYIYYLNVCESVKDTACLPPAPGVCQTKAADHHFAKNIGVANSNLTYYNGILKLIYQNGDKYNSTPPASRTTVITFLCNMNSKIGQPEFIEEANMTYWFSWYTKYACTSPPVECTFTDEKNKKQYDLSQLSLLHTNWDVEDNTDSSEKKKYYINVCRPLSHIAVHHGCSSLAGVCATKFVNGTEVVTNENLGQAISGPTLVDSATDLVLRYTNGKQCIDSDNKTTNYSTTIHFRCKKKILSSGPRFLNIEKNCEYVFLWETEMACAETNTESVHEDCTIKDPNSDYVFNLQPLIKKSGTYEVKVNSRTFLLNICAPLTDSNCTNNNSAVCEKQPTRNASLASSSSKLQLTDGHLRLTYTGKKFHSSEVFQTIIIFVCDPEHDLGIISFINSSQQMYTFLFNTALACAPRPVDCVLQDQKGGQYDLTRLALPDTNWETTVDGTKYIINVCRPVNKAGNITCAGLVGGCQITQDKHVFNIGYVQGKPIALSDGTVSIRYRGGDLCHKGTDKESHRSTRIDFFCSPIEQGIQFQSETEYCEYVFSWKTPAACVVQRVEGDDCKVVDPLYHNQFDLSPLRNKISDYEVKTEIYTFYINVCGPLVSSSDCENGTAACQVTQSLKVKIGSPNKKLIYDDGAIILKYENGQANCHKRFTRKTIITFTCDHTLTGFEGPRYLSEAGDCTYLFEWPTKYACPKIVSSLCKVQNTKGEVFDLSNLALSNSNYIYVTPRLAGQKFILNVCHSLVHKKGETCPFNAASCQISNETDPLKRYHNIGQVGVHPLRFDNGNLELVYENGEPCESPNRKNSSTHIMFVCDMNAFDTSPGDYSVSHGCEHHFMWVTRAACPIQDVVTNNDTCSVTNPATDVTFDLSRLRTLNGYSVSDRRGHRFQLNVCGKVKSNCGNSSGSCQTDLFNKSFNAGIANGKLQFKNGMVFLNYSGGDKCHQGKFHRNTIINFVCNPSANIGQPMFIDESADCTYYFSWHTNLVCEKQVTCSVTNGSQILDLSPLIKANGHHIGQGLSYSIDPGASFYINICRPLNPIYGTLCPPRASVCRVKASEKPLALGSVLSGPYIDPNDHRVTLLYHFGDKCPHSDKNRRTLIKFTCKPGPSLGHPVLIEVIEDCIYIFNWDTYVVCPVSLPHEETECVYTDTQTLTDYNLTSLKKAGVQKISDGLSGFYYLSVCAAISDRHNDCNSSGVCHVDTDGAETSFGDVHKAMFSMHTDLVTLSYENKEKCNETTGYHSNSKIHFLCDANEGLGKPILFQRMTCEVTFLWKTKYVCPSVLKECFLSHRGNSYDLSVLANTRSWIAKDLFGNTYWINVCQGLHSRPKSKQCPGNAAVCMQKADKTMVTLGTVSSQVLHVDMLTPVNNTVLILQYSSDKPVCGNKKAKTIIRFSCANIWGVPHFSHKNEDNCTFEFVWQTRIACKERSVPINDENGIITNPRTSGRIYFGDLTSGKTFHAKELKGPVVYEYTINFDGRIRLDPSKENSSICQGAAVCQTKPSDIFYYKNLGNAQNKNFYFDVHYLDLEITSPERCRSDPSKYVKTIFEFFCSNLDSSDNPKFVYESNECVFFFTWTSSIGCFNYSSLKTEIDAQSTSKSTSKTTVAVIGVFTCLFILSILLLVLSRPEKRAFMMEKMKNMFTKNRTCRARYINISQMDDDEGLLVMESEGGAKSVPYHDDSDEDMIL